MNETQFKQKIRQDIRSTWKGAYTKAVSERFSSGFPDVIAVIEGKTIFLELKVCRTKSFNPETAVNLFTPIQRKVLREIREAKGLAFGLIRHDSTGEIYVYFPMLDSISFHGYGTSIAEFLMPITNTSET